MEKTSKFQVWKYLTIGGKSSEDLLSQLKKNDFRFSVYANDIMSKPAFTTAKDLREVSLVRTKVRNLGFTSAPTTKELFTRAKEQGLYLCPAEAGPRLRLAFTDQPRGDWCWVAMEPITDSGGNPRLFCVGRRVDGERWLRTYCAFPEYRWYLEHGIVFCPRSD